MPPSAFHETVADDHPRGPGLRQQSHSIRLLLDRLVVSVTGAARVRVLPANGRNPNSFSAWIIGQLPGLPPDRILREVLALGPPGPGIIDLHGERPGEWKIRVQGKLGEQRYQQRLRNVLVNS